MFPNALSPSVQTTILLGVPIIAWFLGILCGKSLRMPDHGWKLGLIFAAISLGLSLTAFRPVRQGIDLRGGVILIYEVDEEETSRVANAQRDEELPEEESRVKMGDLITALNERVNPSGVREVVIRPYGANQVEIIVPDASDADLEQLKSDIVTAGFLKFRIVAHPDRNRYEWEFGEAALENPASYVRDSNGKVIAEWVLLGREKIEVPEGEVPPLRFSPGQLSTMLTRELIPNQIEALVLVDDPKFNVEGRHLRNVAANFDESMRPCVDFQMTPEGAQLFSQLTSTNLPEGANNEIKAPLGIIMDGTLISAPVINSTISSRGVIEGQFTQEEVDSIVRVLNAGKLPAVLKKEPISQNKISPLLGEDTIRKGKFAIGVSLIAVLVFMLLYYRFAGIVACFALMANLVLIVALMILIKGSFSLPGLAGLVLTVGMSVDANVLIFERIREELSRGAALRMALRNGFDRATTTIVDANVTTLITAFVLYGVGTETIKGFAIILILGILVSMFTAIFCARVIFEIAERKKWITGLSMMQALGETNINFLGMSKVAAVCSMIAVLAGLVAVTIRGSDILDIDFTGGTSAQFVLNEPMPVGEVRQRLAKIADSVSVTEVQPEGQPSNTVFKVDTSLETEGELQKGIRDAFSGKMKMRELDFSPPNNLQSSHRPSNVGIDQWVAGLSSRSLLWGQIGSAGNSSADQLEEESQEGPTAEVDSDEAVGDSPSVDDAPSNRSNPLEETPADADRTSSATDGVEASTPPTGGLKYLSETTVTLDDTVSMATLREMMERAADELGIARPRAEFANPALGVNRDQPFATWEVKLTTPPSETQKILAKVDETYSSSPVWLSSDKIGSAVAGDMQSAAIAAIVVCLIGIVGYLWFRFQRIGYGLAAVLALVHDVIITLGVVAASLWLSKVLGFLLIDEFRISLPIVAAFLTIIGYSLNDTIVVFDRIREVKGKSPELTEAMMNSSINQTLSRTLLTSLTTLLVVVILYCFGGQAIHGFAFSLLVGVVVGTYSSVFVASPALLWMNRSSTKSKRNIDRPRQRVGV